jgi:hypothetical protein
MPPGPSATYKRLRDYIAERMRMSHIDQPLMLVELLGRCSPAPPRDIARRILGEDVSQIDDYTERVKRMVGRINESKQFPKSPGNAGRHWPIWNHLRVLAYGRPKQEADAG